VVLKRKEAGIAVEQVADPLRAAVGHRRDDEEAAVPDGARRQDEAGSDLLLQDLELRHDGKGVTLTGPGRSGLPRRLGRMLRAEPGLQPSGCASRSARLSPG